MTTPSSRTGARAFGLGAAAVLCTLTASAAAAEICVDARSPGSGDGSRAAPYASIQDAVSAAAPGDVLKVAGTQYDESIEVDTPNLTLEGGYAGATADVYRGGTAGDFDTRDPAAYPTIVEGSGGQPVVAFYGTGVSRIAGMVLRGGQRGILAEGFPADAHQLTVESCILEQNGDPSVEGGGLWAIMPVVVRATIVRDNVGDRGAGLASETSILVEGSVVENNIGHGDHGGGIYGSGDVRVFDSVIRGNRIGETAGYGWGGGIIVFNGGSFAELRGNVVTGNYAPTHGSGEFIDDQADARIMNELIVGNVCPSGNGAGLYVDGLDDGLGSEVELINVTIAGHDCPGSGNAMLVERSSTVTMTSSIVWGNGGASFAIAGGSSLSVRYSDVEEGREGEGNLQVDPQFGDPAAGDYHLRSTSGRPDALGGCVVDGSTSPCIDAGDPAGSFAAEPEPHGGRVDMGAYGNTGLASCDPAVATVATTGATTGGVTTTGAGAGPGSGSGGASGGGGSTGSGDGGSNSSNGSNSGPPVGGAGDGDDGNAVDDAGDGGCGCEAVGASPARQGAFVALVGAAFCLARRRRRAPTA